MCKAQGKNRNCAGVCALSDTASNCANGDSGGVNLSRENLIALAFHAQISHYGAANPENVAKMAVKSADALINQMNGNNELATD